MMDSYIALLVDGICDKLYLYKCNVPFSILAVFPCQLLSGVILCVRIYCWQQMSHAVQRNVINKTRVENMPLQCMYHDHLHTV